MRLLLVEDEAELAEAVQLGLVRAGYAVDSRAPRPAPTRS